MTASYPQRKTRIISSLGSEELSDCNAKASGPNQGHLDFVRVNIADLTAATLEHFAALSDQRGLILDFLPKSRAKVLDLTEPLYFKAGETIVLSEAAGAAEENHIDIVAEDFSNLFKVGEKVFLGFGGLTCIVTDVSNAAAVKLEVKVPGHLNPSSFVHVPGTRKQKKAGEIIPALQPGVTWEAIRKSAVACIVPGYFQEQDLKELGANLKNKSNEGPWIFYKIDSEESLKNYRNILDDVRGIMLSRRELALSVEPALLPILTKKVLETCHENAKVIWVASEIFGTMANKPIPTRAEVSDLANVVIDGAHGVMPSQEIKPDTKEAALQLMHDVIIDMENDKTVEPNWQVRQPKIREEMDAIAVGALVAATRVGAKAIVCITESGNTACKLASLGPSLPVIGVTFDKLVAKRLRLVRGVQGVYLDCNPKLDEVLTLIKDKIKETTMLQKGDLIVFVSVTLSSVSSENSNLFTIQTV